MLNKSDSIWGVAGQKLQALVYIFMALTGLAVAAVSYFALTFTIIEAGLTGLVVVALSIVIFERTLRKRAEDDLARQVEDLSKLLSTDAHAGQILSQRVNEIARINAEQRLSGLEADLSVLGTVVQQVAESVADLERFNSRLENKIGGALDKPAPAAAEPEHKWMLTSQDAERALRDGRVDCRLQNIISLPHRRPVAYDVMAALVLPNGDIAGVMDIGPGRSRDAALRAFDQLAYEKAFALAKQSAAAETSHVFHTRLSRASLGDPAIADQIAEMLDQSTSAAKKVSFIIVEKDWRQLSPMERSALAGIVEKGARVSLDQPSSLRLNFPELFQAGVRSVRADATRFVDSPQSYAEFHSSDISDYISRYDIDLMATGVRNEQQVLALIEDKLGFVIGNYFGVPTHVPDNLFAPDEFEAQKAVGGARAVS